MDRLEIGEVLKPQGIRGEVKIRTFTDENVPVRGLKRLFIGGEEYKVLSFRDGINAICKKRARKSAV